MKWQETSGDIWTITLGNSLVKIATFKPTYDRQHWHFSINNKDSSEGFGSLQGAQAAALRAAIAQISETRKQLEQAEQDAAALIKEQERTVDSGR